MVHITISNKIHLSPVPPLLHAELRDRLTILNPKWLENDRHGYWNGKTPKHLRFFERTKESLFVPRGFLNELKARCDNFGVDYTIRDHTRVLSEQEFQFHGTLRPYQEEAVKFICGSPIGTLAAPTGSGKTMVGLYMIAYRKQPTIIIVHTKELQDQWINRIKPFLGIPKKEIGRIGGGTRSAVGEKVTVALVQSLYKVAHRISVGHVIADECHRVPSRTFSEAIADLDAKYLLGLSATHKRRDGLHKLIYWYLGGLVHEIPKEELLETGDLLPVVVVTRTTTFQPSNDIEDPAAEYSKMLCELTEDEVRNELIARDVVIESQNKPGVCLVLSDRKSHCWRLHSRLLHFGVEAEVLTGDVKKSKRRELVDSVNNGSVKVLIATGQLIGEGFDCENLSTLFLATPIKFSGRVIQYLGRILRPKTGKKARVYDYRDPVGVLISGFNQRQKVFAGYEEAKEGL